MQYLKKIIFFFLPIYLFSQDYSNQWIGHYSYFQIKDLYASNSRVYAASENAFFIYDIESKTKEKFSTITGLSGGNISSIYYSTVYNITAVGYENGMLEVLIDDNKKVKTFIDIVNKPSIQPNQKRINHFFEYDKRLYLSTGFGIVEFNMEKIEFGDTFFIGSGGEKTKINETSVVGDFIYAATDVGLLKANVNSTDLVDFNQWTTVISGVFKGVFSFNNQILVWENDTSIKRLIGSTLTTVVTTPSAIKYIYTNTDNLVITLSNGSLLYDTNFLSTGTIVSSGGNSFTLNVSLVVNDKVYLGTQTRGVLEVDKADSSKNTSITPEGPLFNEPYRVEAMNNNVWVVYGKYDINYNPYPLQSKGISRFTKNKIWKNIPNTELLGTTSLSYISINPRNEEQVFISSFQDGLLEINNNVATNLYNTTNSGLETMVDGDQVLRMNGSVFDKNGELWIVNSRVKNGLKRFSIETAKTFDVNLNPVIPNINGEFGFSDVVLDKEGNVFLGAFKSGVIGYNVTSKKLLKLSGDKEGSGLPSNFIKALEVDKNNQLWIGAYNGIRVLYNTNDAFNSNNVKVNNITFKDNQGVAQELLFGQEITDIEVDESNNKWISTGSSGVFYLSSDGKKTLAHFTKDNSPLPTNNVLDLSVDDTTGSVYFATTKGLLEYRGTSLKANDNLDNVVVYPNPVRPGFNKSVVIKGLTKRANIKITDIEGNLVHEVISSDGSVEWDTTAFGRHKVASGVYLILITGEEQALTTVSKLMIIR